MTTLSLIFAQDMNGGIGNKGALPWPRMQADMERFRRHTEFGCVIMGRATYESIGHPLRNRLNIVITRSPVRHPKGVVIEPSLEKALGFAQRSRYQEVFVIGGAKLFTLALPYATRVYQTVIYEEFAADTFFDFSDDGWCIHKDTEYLPDSENPYPYRFRTLTRE